MEKTDARAEGLLDAKLNRPHLASATDRELCLRCDTHMGVWGEMLDSGLAIRSEHGPGVETNRASLAPQAANTWRGGWKGQKKGAATGRKMTREMKGRMDVCVKGGREERTEREREREGGGEGHTEFYC